MKAKINFYNTNNFDIKLDKKLISQWLSKVIQSYGFNYTEINYSLYSDDELLKLNKKFLNHNFYTDIITFDNTIAKTISADIAISIDRIKDNSSLANLSFENELYRVIVHGILHCIGYKDDTDKAKQAMRHEENKALNMFHVEHKTTIHNV